MKTESQEKISKILENYSYKPEKLIPILQKVQDEYNYLPKDVMDFIAYKLNIPSARVFGVATFFAHFAITPKGKYIIKVCDGTACHVKKSEAIINKIKEKLNLTNSNTSEDGLFTLECVSCLGACGLAPVVVIGGDVHAQVTTQQISDLIDGIKNEAKK
ncbi:MAG: NADH-quinone oxidoreductase subunit NuoE [Elusimicrobiaceae bacterium]|jgi:NADH-quinone oxidoreductase subunit E|nr:NADH-quinone oxidoreductase subunit NuoE [Elusimicrobiaceae bacterium]MBT3954812.1 NADH-quinone oxidoreductase subunit NuoE [Elusimicrobiaceae bacterium]MBT4008806.1 NADH-quinone oxidoreductase subunit NuoE [Elusimicrobiaceae bacterium]MBT4402250.1 NADH-quinone oxidoreductase subunit NuoE [Elusimicrobiaceae bacterium]MBT4440293.1 NADH-quinone oxidoreductase subunit NuoE [Elusimicrobiaceae bacterium]